MSTGTAILGIHDGHNCGATLLQDGVIVASVSEERLTRKKNEVGFPEKSIHEVLRIGGIGVRDLDEVAYASLFMHAPNYLKDLEPWYTVGYADQVAAESRPEDYQRLIFDQRRRERVQQVVALLGIPETKVAFVEHHLAHVAGAYYTAPLERNGKDVLGITCDGSGDGLCATVSNCNGSRIQRIAQTSRHASLGKIYSRVTMLMGMKPWEHEYKLMGLAPYADPALCEKTAKILDRLLKMRDDNLGFEQAGELSTNFCYQYLRENFERIRFDVVAGATQLFTEKMLISLVRGAIAHTGIRNVVCGGGVFMNVKANMLIADIPELDSLYVMPSAGDESLSIGACLQRYYQKNGEMDHSRSAFTGLYLGGEFNNHEEERAIQETLRDRPVRVTVPADMEQAIAELIAGGRIAARFKGRMEWGARALGNRSILASAHDRRVVDKINRMIKMRDFWMPFAPSVTAESASRYFDDPKELRPYFMTFAYRTKEGTYQDLAAGSHPSDRTIRPQVVTKEINADYHRLITKVEQITGRGVVLNTSFNLHGHPIVYSPRDAIEVFLDSGLEYLALGKFLIAKELPS